MSRYSSSTAAEYQLWETRTSLFSDRKLDFQADSGVHERDRETKTEGGTVNWMISEMISVGNLLMDAKVGTEGTPIDDASALGIVSNFSQHPFHRTKLRDHK